MGRGRTMPAPYQRVLSLVGIYLAGGWGLLEFSDWAAVHFGFSPVIVNGVMAAWLLGLPLLVLVAWPRHAGSPSTGAPPAPLAAPHRPALPSVAVLPFACLSSAAEDAHLSDGITDEIVNTLGRLEGLSVASRTSAAVYARGGHDVREMGRHLGVDAVLEGSVQRAGERLRVSTRLVDVATGHHLWAERFDSGMADIFDVEDSIAENVAVALRVILKEQDRRMIARSPTRSVHAYEHYLRGRQFLQQTRLKSLQYAREMFCSAVELDPEFARAHAGIADSIAVQRLYYPDVGDLDEAERAAGRALELEPGQAEGHSSMGAVHFLRGRCAEAEAEFREAVRLDSRLFEARYFYARMCFQLGRFADAERLFEDALHAREDYQAAFFAAQSSEALGGGSRAAELYARALAVVERHMELNPDDARAATMRAVALCRLGRVDEGLHWAERALFADPEDAGVRYNVACLYAVAGNPDRAIACLQDAVRGGFGNRDWLERDPDLDGVRDDPRFPALMAGM
jgi:adenylate cyclase